MFKYKPKNKDCKQMSANGHLVTQEGLSSETTLPDLEKLVQAGILVREHVNIKELEEKAAKEKKEAEEAKLQADKLAQEAKAAADKAKKEEAEVTQANEKVKKAKSRKKKNKPSSE